MPAYRCIAVRLGSHTRWLPRKDLVMATQVSRQYVIDWLRRLGFPQLVDEASRDLPDPVDLEQVYEFGHRHQISLDELISRMGGSP